VSVIAWGSGRLAVFVDPSALCMRCLMDNRANSSGHQFESLEAPSDASALSVWVAVETLCDYGGRGHRYNPWDRK